MKNEDRQQEGAASMCSGYYLEKAEWMHKIAGAARHHSLMQRISSTIAKPVMTCGDVHLSDIAPVIAPDGKGGGRVYPMMWGFFHRTGRLYPVCGYKYP